MDSPDFLDSVLVQVVGGIALVVLGWFAAKLSFRKERKRITALEQEINVIKAKMEPAQGVTTITFSPQIHLPEQRDQAPARVVDPEEKS